MVFLLILGFVFVVVLEVPWMVARRQTGELRAFWVLLAIGFFLSLSVVERWPLPNPTPVLEAVFGPVATMLGLE